MWSTIKTLPATLPEPALDRGPRTGVTGPFLSQFGYMSVGRADNGARLLRVGPWFWDWRRRWGIVLDAGFRI